MMMLLYRKIGRYYWLVGTVIYSLARVTSSITEARAVVLNVNITHKHIARDSGVARERVDWIPRHRPAIWI